jgi:hypothetical protein
MSMRICIFILIILLYCSLSAQDEPLQGLVTRATIIDGDTVPVLWIPEVHILGPKIFKNRSEALSWSKLVRNIKKVYPYSKLAAIKMKEYNEILRPIESKRERKKIVRSLENELFKGFEDELKKLTYSQGKILIKLIDRETGSPTFDIIKEYRGTIMAGFWQTLGRVFGYNLKEGYDPNGKDIEIETIVIMIENGVI